jgi:hypothetical protein
MHANCSGGPISSHLRTMPWRAAAMKREIHVIEVVRREYFVILHFAWLPNPRAGGSLLHEYSKKVEKQINTHELHVFIKNKTFIYLIIFCDF